MRPVGGVFLGMSVSLCLSLLLAAGCGGSAGGEAGPGEGEPRAAEARTIPMQTLAQGTASDYGRFDHQLQEDEAPECVVIGGDEELQKLLYLAGLQLPERDVDFDRYLVLAAMQGAKNSAGYAISIARAEQRGGEVRVDVEVSEPEEGAFTAQILTSPYHLVLVERGAFDPRGELVFVFTDNHGRTLARSSTEV